MMADPHRGDWRTVSGALAIMVTIMVALAALTPYVVLIPKDNLNLITQAQTTLWNGWLLILGFYFGTTQSQGKKDETIQILSRTAQTAGAALAPPPVPDVVVAPGDSVTVTADKELPP